MMSAPQHRGLPTQASSSIFARSSWKSDSDNFAYKCRIYNERVPVVECVPQGALIIRMAIQVVTCQHHSRVQMSFQEWSISRDFLGCVHRVHEQETETRRFNFSKGSL